MADKMNHLSEARRRLELYATSFIIVQRTHRIDTNYKRTGTRGAAQQHGLAIVEPRAQNELVTNGVDGVHDEVRVDHLRHAPTTEQDIDTHESPSVRDLCVVFVLRRSRSVQRWQTSTWQDSLFPTLLPNVKGF